MPALLFGQLASIAPDLQFHYARMPHEPSIGSLLLGGWAWIVMAYGWRAPAIGVGVTALGLVAVAYLVARPAPDTLAEFPVDTPPLAAAHSR